MLGYIDKFQVKSLGTWCKQSLTSGACEADGCMGSYIIPITISRLYSITNIKLHY